MLLLQTVLRLRLLLLLQVRLLLLLLLLQQHLGMLLLKMMCLSLLLWALLELTGHDEPDRGRKLLRVWPQGGIEPPEDCEGCRHSLR